MSALLEHLPVWAVLIGFALVVAAGVLAVWLWPVDDLLDDNKDD